MSQFISLPISSQSTDFTMHTNPPALHETHQKETQSLVGFTEPKSKRKLDFKSKSSELFMELLSKSVSYKENQHMLLEEGF